MSVFDNHLNSDQMRNDEDKIILANYKISNSGATLIPRKGLFALTPQQKRMFSHKTSKIPEGTFREERSIFQGMYGNMNDTDAGYLYPIFEEIIRGMGLPCLVYNKKRYYQANREVKRQIAYNIHKRING
jgi:hypothetical protein